MRVRPVNRLGLNRVVLGAAVALAIVVGNGSTARARSSDSSPFELYLGPGSASPAEYPLSYHESPPFSLYLGPPSSGSATSDPFQLDLSPPYGFTISGFDDTKYQSGVESATITLETHSIYTTTSHLEVSIWTSADYVEPFEVARVTFPIDQGETLTSVFTWPIPSSSRFVDYSVTVHGHDLDHVTGGTITLPREHAYMAFPLPRTTVEDVQAGIQQEFVELDLECGEAVLSLLPVASEVSELLDFSRNVEVSWRAARQGDVGRSFTAFASMTANVTMASLKGLIDFAGLKPGLAVIAPLKSLGYLNTSIDCMGSWLHDSLFGSSPKLSEAAPVDSLLQWSRSAQDSTGVEVADILFFEGKAVPSVDSRGSWAREDSTTLQTVSFLQISEELQGIYVLPDVRALEEDPGANPNNEARFSVVSRSRQFMRFGILHYDPERGFLNQRYPPVELLNASVVAVSVGRTGEEFPLLVDKDGDGSTDFEVHPLDPGVTVDAPSTRFTTKLMHNFPNPFNPRTEIVFSLASQHLVVLDIYDARGRHVRSLAQSVFSTGVHHVSWEGEDDRGVPVGSGVYFCRLIAGDYRSEQKIAVLR